MLKQWPQLKIPSATALRDLPDLIPAIQCEKWDVRLAVSPSIFRHLHSECLTAQSSLGHLMHRKRKLLRQPTEPLVNAGRLVLSICKNGASRHWRYLTRRRHERHCGTLDASAKANYVNRFIHTAQFNTLVYVFSRDNRHYL